MSAPVFFGYILLAAPFVGVFILITRESGVLTAAGVFAATASIIAVIAVGAHLVAGGPA